MMIRYFILFFISFSCCIQASDESMPGVLDPRERMEKIYNIQKLTDSEINSTRAELENPYLVQQNPQLSNYLWARLNLLKGHQKQIEYYSLLSTSGEYKNEYMSALARGAVLRMRLDENTQMCNYLRQQPSQQGYAAPVQDAFYGNHGGYMNRPQNNVQRPWQMHPSARNLMNSAQSHQYYDQTGK